MLEEIEDFAEGTTTVMWIAAALIYEVVATPLRLIGRLLNIKKNDTRK